MAQFSLDTLPEECKLCLAKGDNGGHKYSHEVMSKNYNRNTGEMSVPPSQVYVFTGTKCDLACQMCDSSFSDTHARVFPDRIIPIVDVSVDKPLHIVNRYPGVQLVVYGGEPFLAKETYDIVKLGLLKGDLISFLSNGNRSYRNNRIFQELILPNPDRFSVCISIDGYPSLNEKIRVNARTDVIVDNVKYCQENNIFCDVHFTASKLNAPEFPEFVKWLITEGLYDYKYFTINSASVDFPEDFKVNQLPEEEKIKALVKIREFRENLSSVFPFNEKQQADIVKCCDGIITSLEE
jgi:MoaA/NifB/PqqE/SkfB family radical SAM enzyme